MKIELRRCLGCGGQASLVQAEAGSGYWYGACKQCRTQGRHFPTPVAAAAHWNRETIIDYFLAKGLTSTAKAVLSARDEIEVAGASGTLLDQEAKQ